MGPIDWRLSWPPSAPSSVTQAPEFLQRAPATRAEWLGHHRADVNDRLANPFSRFVLIGERITNETNVTHVRNELKTFAALVGVL